MHEHYPDIELKADTHPFLMFFCHGRNIHDIYTNIDFPEQEELLFAFPVMYSHDDGNMYLSSYVPVLYLDSFMGVVGGLIYGLRKEFHARMQHEETESSYWWKIDGIIDAAFEKHTEQKMTSYPQFVEQTLAHPFITRSYPAPLAKLYVYNLDFYPSKILKASESFTWHYEGATLQNSEDTWSLYSEYHFSMSRPMRAKRYFNSGPAVGSVVSSGSSKADSATASRPSVASALAKNSAGNSAGTLSEDF